MSQFTATPPQPDILIAKKKIAALKVGDTILFKPSTPMAPDQFLSGTIERIFRAHDGTRIFSIDDRLMLIQQERLLLPDWETAS